MDILTNLSLFSGAGGLDLGARLVGGFRTIGYVEYDAYAQGVLMSRMREGALDTAPIWDDVRTFDGKPWRGLVDVVSGGFPCQDVSVAGKQAGIEAGERSGLWREFARIIGEVGPRFVLVENVPGLAYRGGLGTVLGSLADLGFDAQWQFISAADVGAPHLRARIWIVAYSKLRRLEVRRGAALAASAGERPNGVCGHEPQGGEEQKGNVVADAKGIGWGEGRAEPAQQSGRPLAVGVGDPISNADSEGRKADGRPREEWLPIFVRGNKESDREWAPESNICRVAHGVAFRVDRLRCTGNGVVPQQSAAAWQKIKDWARGIE